VDLYDLLKSIHVLAAVIWVGGGFVLQFFASRVDRAGDQVQMANFGENAEWLGTRIFMPASIIVLLSGIWAVSEGGWSYTDFWTLWGFFGVLASAVIGAAYLGPESGRLAKLIAERGQDDPEVAQRRSRIFLVSRIELLVLLSVVVVMTIKPGL
jgi:uncharacterized membrane protein